MFAKQHVNMKNIVTETQNRMWPVLVIQTSLKNRKELEKLMVRIKEIDGVESVSYKILLS